MGMTMPWTLVWKHTGAGSVISVSATPNVSAIVCGAVDRQVTLLDGNGTVKWCTTLNYEVWATAISADGSRIAAGTAEKNPARGSLYVLDALGQVLWQFPVAAPIWCVALSSNGKRGLAGCWDGNLYAFEETDRGWIISGKLHLGKSGAYGVALSDDGVVGAAVEYDVGVHILDWPVDVRQTVSLQDAGYHAALSAFGGHCVIGLRNGTAAIVDCKSGKYRLTKQISQRPICGASISANGSIIVLGSFDGSVYFIDKEGRTLWSAATDGEVWDVALSRDGRFIVVGSGDSTVRMLESSVANAALQEIGAVEERASERYAWTDKQALVNDLVSTYLRYGLVDYGRRVLLELRHSNVLDATLVEHGLERLYKEALSLARCPASVNYYYGEFLEQRRLWWQAAIQYLEASADLDRTTQALFRAGLCFARCGHTSAAQSCFRRTKEVDVNSLQKRVLYNLARSYEDSRRFGLARVLYDILLTWDLHYRDVVTRSLRLDSVQGQPSAPEYVDYTGLTVNYLGPDAAKAAEVGTSLEPVVTARNKELVVSSLERGHYATSLSSLRFNELNAVNEQLSYDIIAYLKYDHSPPEDEVKKRLELINVRAILNQMGAKIVRSLDIGAATGRYPMLLAAEGVEAIGIDREEKAMRYAQEKLQGDHRPFFTVGSADKLPFHAASFDLVTCMMGTFAHMSEGEKKELCSEALRVLRKGGVFIISTWDIECPHLSFLSIYNEEEKRKIADQSVTKELAKQMFLGAGFDEALTRSFCLIPDVLTYELGVQKLGNTELDMLISIDLAVRATFGEANGQMYIVAGRKLNDG